MSLVSKRPEVHREARYFAISTPVVAIRLDQWLDHGTSSDHVFVAFGSFELLSSGCVNTSVGCSISPSDANHGDRWCGAQYQMA